ncbi:Transcriptional regulator, AraC family [Thermobacillus xylanilyticus]|uniref:Transcriptional regulator, AraC family n=1 Tax=Thermobacillus xylanilyticus TaxID=76633 RepID=A0ABM8V0X3_THEXY|nr:helix-turn-helix domain-containing protein [Thermobacillus xylanilyticus]CAG5080000.1 Transcriptional regulator, AraC family [Thermobacillus xylanilyticus]
MSRLTVRRLTPRMELRKCVKDIWVFESAGGLSEEELQVVVPNGSAKLMLYYKGDFTGLVCQRAYKLPEHKLFILGVSDCAAVAEFDRDKPFGCICFELHPAGAYRLLAVSHHELRNNLVPFEEIDGGPVYRMFEERICLASDPAQKALLLQDYLMRLLALTESDAKFEYSIHAIRNSRGLLPIADLSQDLGVSDRWLRAKYAERLGISPKTFASIVRFQHCFQALMRDKRGFMENRQFQDYYYDQAHFIKEFKRFIGHSPARYSSLQNEVGEIIYTDNP